MTYEEALSRANFCIEEWKMFLKDKANTVEAVRYQNDSSQMQFFEVAAEAINKQIPKKPKKTDRADIISCFNCGYLFAIDTYKFLRCCPKCGQAIDWSGIYGD